MTLPTCHHAPRPRHVAWLVILLIAAAALVLSRGQAPAASDHREPEKPETYRVVGDGSLPTHRPALGAPHDPLSAEEVGYALHLATSDGSVPPSARDVRGRPGPEVLVTDLPPGPSGRSRSAVVTLYDYASDVGYQQTVDLQAGDVRSRRVAGLPGPMSADEAAEATRIAIHHTPSLPLRKEFEAAMGVPLVVPDQLHYVAGAFLFDGSTSGGRACGRQRCAQLLLQLPSGTFLTTSGFVVNLSTRTVVATDGGAE